MKLFNLFTVGLMVAGLLVTSCQDDVMESEAPPLAEDAQVAAASEIAGQYIVVFKEDAVPHGRLREPTFTSRAAKAAYSRTNRKRVTKRVKSVLARTNVASGEAKRIFSSVLSGFAAEMTADEAQKLAQDSTVAFVEPDREITLDYEVEAIYTKDELLSQQSNARQTTTCATDNAGGAGNGSGSKSFIWIVDTGIDLDHPDLNVNRTYARSFVSGERSPDDGNGHGTHVAGIAAAVANDTGILGVSAGAPVVPIKVLGSNGSGTNSGFISGMDYIASEDIVGDVVNISLGGPAYQGCSSNNAIGLALNRLNNQSLIAVAAGNESQDATFSEPACHSLPNVYTVASMTCDRSFSSFSNYGQPVDWIATGSSVKSTYPGGRYATLSGTSMASPVVAGVLHQRGRAPRACGTVTFRGVSYPVACR